MRFSRSLLPMLEGGEGHDEAIGEYFGEGVVAPLVMIRRGRWKFVHSPADPDQLYDLQADPKELRNLAAEPAAGEVLSGFRAEAWQRWDFGVLRAEVIASQRRRHFQFAATRGGTPCPWDHQPVLDASRRYVRNHIDLDTLEAMARFPRVG